MNIDFVMPWVDGSDPAWIRKRNSYMASGEAAEECRFRDWDLLRFWFRSVEAYAPWVNRIHLITDGQVPQWLNRAHPKLNLVDHRDYIPEKYLPTFSSHTIELNLHRIEGLSEHFVYFNDDMFLNRPVKPEDFFRNVLPCDTAICDAFFPYGSQDAYVHALCNVMAFINARFDKKTVMRSNPKLWFSPAYGMYVLKNLYFTPVRYLSDLKHFHVCNSMLRSTFETLWETETEILDSTCQNKFRSISDVNQYLFTYYNICSGKFVPRNPRFGECYTLGRNNRKLLDDISTGKHKVLCLNDNPYVTDFEGLRDQLIRCYQEKFPNKSAYEI
jgi:hypothetical protein